MTLRELAEARCQELLTSGKKSFNSEVLLNSNFPETGARSPGVEVNTRNQVALVQLFPKLRAEADDWAAKRDAYMLAKLKKGLHPDTNPDFWDEWKPAAPPRLDVRWFNEGEGKYDDQLIATPNVAVLGLLVVLVSLPTFFFLHFAKRRRYELQCKNEVG